jgi:hypothetical protein
MYNQEGRLNMHKVTCHVLCALPNSQKGFIASVLKPNLMFLASPAVTSLNLCVCEFRGFQKLVMSLCAYEINKGVFFLYPSLKS